MNLLDMRTIMFSYMFSNTICLGVMAFLWRQNRKQTPGLGYWLADFLMQFASVVLIALRGIVPDFFSMVVSNSLVVGGTFLLLEGLAKYLGKSIRQIQNVLYLVLFIIIQSYFTFYQPNLLARTVNFSIGLIFSCGQCAWLMLSGRRSEPGNERKLTGFIFAAYGLLSAVRIFVDSFTPHSSDFFNSGLYDSLVILTFQMLFVLLTFSLFLIVNRKIFKDLETDISLRRKAEKKLRSSEEKFSVTFQNHPDAILISEIMNGRIIEANESFFLMSGYSKAETVGRTTVELRMWAHLDEREKYVRRLQKEGRLQNYEAKFRRKSGELFTGWISSGIITIQDKKFILSVIKDISEQKRIQDAHELDSQMMTNITDGIFLHKLSDDTIVFANPQFERLFGYGRNELIGQKVAILNAGDDRQAQKLAREIQTALGRHGSWNGEILNRRKDGSHFWSHVSASVFEHKDFGKVVISVHQDITERKQAEEKIKANDDRLQALTDILQFQSESTQDFLDHALEQALLLTKSQLGYIYFYNEEMREFTLNTWSREVMKECTIQDPQTVYQLEKTGIWGEAVRQRKPIVLNDYLAAHPLKKGYPQGHAPLKKFMTIPVIINGKIVAVIGMANKTDDYTETDVLQLSLLMNSVWRIVEQRQTEKALQESEAELKALFASMQDVVITFNHEGRYLKVATTNSQLLINPPEALIGKRIHEVIPRDIADRWLTHIHNVIDTQTTKHIEYSLMVDGREIWFDAAVSPLDKETVVWVARDITARKLMEEKSYFIGTHDQLTGAFNRAYFEEELKRLERSRRYPISILMLDLDNLKEVNDSRGHAAGDELLQRTVRAMGESLRSEDIFARIGGDEFAAILPSTDETAAELVQRRLQQNIDQANRDQPVKLYISAGWATCLKGGSLIETMKKADAGMYQIKRLKQGGATLADAVLSEE